MMSVFDDLQRKMAENRKLLDALKKDVEAGRKTLSYEEAKSLMERPGMDAQEIMSLYRLSKRMTNGEEQPEPEPEKPEVKKVTKEEVAEAFQRAKSSRRPQDIMWYSKLKRLHEEWLRYQEEKCDD